MLTLDKVYQAHDVLKPVIRNTELISAPGLSKNCSLFLKPENLQITGSFKVRGSYFKIASLSNAEKSRGVMACSAGNHAQGVALAAKKNNIPATIFLPSTAPISKIEETRGYGANIKLIDGIYDDAYTAAIEYGKENGDVFIHPFDDYDVIAGQGTIALEIYEQIKNLDAVVVPVGGGGLVSGIAFVIKKLNPECWVYGVQANGAGSMALSMKKGKKCSKHEISTFADGIAVKTPGSITYDLCSQYVDDIVTVSDDEIAYGILAMMEKQKLVAEGAGAVAVAAILCDKLPVKGKKVCAVVSGGNIDVNILSRVITRGLLKTGRKGNLTIELVDRPGQLSEVANIIGSMGANVTGVYHDRGPETDIRDCCLKIAMETKDFEHLNSIKEEFSKKGYKLRSSRFNENIE